MKQKTLNRDQILKFFEDHKGELDKYGVTNLGLFGSYVRDEQQLESDIDILVEFDKAKKTYQNFIKLNDYLEKSFGKPVELVTTESLSPYIGPHIKKEVEYVKIAA